MNSLYETIQSQLQNYSFDQIQHDLCDIWNKDKFGINIDNQDDLNFKMAIQLYGCSKLYKKNIILKIDNNLQPLYCPYDKENLKLNYNTIDKKFSLLEYDSEFSEIQVYPLKYYMILFILKAADLNNENKVKFLIQLSELCMKVDIEQSLLWIDEALLIDQQNQKSLVYKMYYLCQKNMLCESMQIFHKIQNKIENQDKINNIFKKCILDLNPHQIQPREKIEIILDSKLNVKMMRNFSWVIFGKIIGMSIPTQHEQILALQQMNVSLIVTAMEEPLPKDLYANTFIQNHHVKTENYKAPTLQDIDIYMSKAEEQISLNKVIAVHCGGGKGRAGTLLTCFIIKHGIDGSLNDQSEQNCKMSYKEAINYIRLIRPGSIETQQQEDFLKSYQKYLEQQVISQKEEEYEKLSQKQKLILKNIPSMICLIGLPGSGKSTFCELLMTVNRQDAPNIHFQRASQDDDGKQEFEKKISNLSKNKNISIIVDRTNLKKDDRQHILNIANNPKNTLCIVFDFHEEEIVQRLQKRINHPTFDSAKFTQDQLFDLAKKTRAKLLSQIDQLQLEFSEIKIISNEEQMFQVLENLGSDLNIIKLKHDIICGKWTFFKFPRTRHLWNTGSATDDDELSNHDQQSLYFGNHAQEVLVQEKVDGANLGISIDDQECIVFQNRGKIVNYATETQFKKLKKFEEKYAECFREILTKRYIMFGEWCTLKHSIYYDKLPSEFLVFDIYDRHHKKFLSYQKVKEKLQGYSFDIVPMIIKKKFLQKTELSQLLEQNSIFREGKVEGVYLRIEKNGFCIDRCKLVRPDFVQGITTHWKTMEKIENKFLNAY